MINNREMPYWMALAHIRGWKNEQINKLIIKVVHEEDCSLEEFFNLSSIEWSNKFGLTEKEIIGLENTRNELPNYSFLAEDLLEQGYEVIPISDSEYSTTLKENLKAKNAPPVLYIKGNKQILQENSIAIVGSRNASEISLKFTDNIAKLASRDYKVVVSGFAKGVDKQALDSALKYKGQSIIVLPQGIMTFSSGFKKYYRQIVEGDLLVLCTFFPKTRWSVQLAMARNSIIYGLAKEIYVAESSEKGGTWSGVMDGLRKGRKFFVRKPEFNEKNANVKLIEKGAIPVNFDGQPISEDRLSTPENYLVEEGKKGNNIDIIIFKTLQNGALTSKQILQKTNLDWSTRKLTDYLKTKKEIQVSNKKPLKFQLKNLSYQTKLFV